MSDQTTMTIEIESATGEPLDIDQIIGALREEDVKAKAWAPGFHILTASVLTGAHRSLLDAAEFLNMAMGVDDSAASAELAKERRDAWAAAVACHDYSGGHKGDTLDAYRHGIDTVISVLKERAEVSR